MPYKHEGHLVQTSDKAPPPRAPSDGLCEQCSCSCHGTIPSPAVGGETYKLNIWFIPKADGKPNDTQADWMAKMDIVTGDLPRLMRDGFHWGPANVLREKGSIRVNNAGLTKAKGDWRMRRRYALTDLADEPQWTASLFVFAQQGNVLARFRVSDLSWDLIYFAWAEKEREEYIYRFDASAPENNYNAIYDDMPMNGWWPWPRPKETSNVVAEPDSWESWETE